MDNYEAIELCPHCGNESFYPGWDVKTQGYVAVCQHCGKQIMLCDECRHAEDGINDTCDWWDDGTETGTCFRRRGEY